MKIMFRRERTRTQCHINIHVICVVRRPFSFIRIWIWKLVFGNLKIGSTCLNFNKPAVVKLQPTDRCSTDPIPNSDPNQPPFRPKTQFWLNQKLTPNSGLELGTFLCDTSNPSLCFIYFSFANSNPMETLWSKHRSEIDFRLRHCENVDWGYWNTTWIWTTRYESFPAGTGTGQKVMNAFSGNRVYSENWIFREIKFFGISRVSGNRFFWEIVYCSGNQILEERSDRKWTASNDLS